MDIERLKDIAKISNHINVVCNLISAASYGRIATGDIDQRRQNIDSLVISLLSVDPYHGQLRMEIIADDLTTIIREIMDLDLSSLSVAVNARIESKTLEIMTLNSGVKSGYRYSKSYGEDF